MRDMHEPVLTSLLARISQAVLTREAECVRALVETTAPVEARWPAIRVRARGMVERLREEGLGFSVETFLQEYGLSSREGVAVMCLAEALLRIPDRETADRLIASTFTDTQWESHLGKSESVFVNASSWGLLMTGSVLQWGKEEEGVRGVLGSLARRAGEPVIREAMKAAMRLVAGQFVLGETIEAALQEGNKLSAKGYLFSYDMLGEGARDAVQAERYFQSYLHAIRTLGKRDRTDETSIYAAPGISIKLTALHPRYEWRQKERVMAELLPRLKELVRAAREAGICVAIDAEEATRLDLELEVFAALYTDTEFADYPGIGFVLQAYQKRAIHVLDLLIELATRTGKRMPLRLVKGAYWDSEVKAAQVAGLDAYPVFTVKEHSDVSYLACAEKMLKHATHFFPQFATHNAATISAIIEMAGSAEFEFQRLFGMGEKLYEPVVERHACRIYAPIGEHRDLLAYLIRRLLENGANSSFVHLMMEKELPLDVLLQSPMEVAKQDGAEGVVLPVGLYSDRKNSSGIDFGNRFMLEALQAQMNVDVVSRDVADAHPDDVDSAIRRAADAGAAWSARGVEVRASILERVADALEAQRGEAMQLLTTEAKKTVPDALAEVREAADFCRYYAAQARRLQAVPTVLEGPTGERNTLSLHARGVWVAISPWNFPLAIFMGQVSAALVTGNAVIAKPAEQTPRIAAFAVALLHEAGVPREAVQLLCGSGEIIGQALVTHPLTAGVVFTGSTDTARHINRALAAREGAILPFIAETGGQNCMVLDSSVLLEQAVDDVVHSAFGSAGQRCSALRVVYVHEDIAEAFVTLLAGAMQELRVGDPAALATDIGPVIDAAAREPLLEHIERMTREVTMFAATPLDATLEDDSYVAPHAFEIRSLTQLPGEVFGPILHVIRYRDIQTVIADINSTGFGLTFGIHSRIAPFHREVTEAIRAGNHYVNRGMTGAVVGVQPFGGEGLSGTGPKAGGPHYLLRFVTERVMSVNTAAVGGNIELLMGKPPAV